MSDNAFLKIKCEECKNEQIVFERPAQDVECLVCEEVLVESTGGRGEVKMEIQEKLE